MARVKAQVATKVPTHIGIIPDGNRRWAKAHGLSKQEGHKQGYVRVQATAERAFELGVQYVSIYIFSVENWDRDQTEVNFLMNLSQRIFTKELRELDKKNIKIMFLGSRERINKKLKQAIEEVEQLTENNDGGVLALCFDYSGQDEIIAATQRLIRRGATADQITKDALKAEMYSRGMPDPDLIIRTSNEQRLSNFLLWGSGYAELYFTPVMWPEFSETDLEGAIAEYAHRQRRYGK